MRLNTNRIIKYYVIFIKYYDKHSYCSTAWCIKTLSPPQPRAGCCQVVTLKVNSMNEIYWALRSPAKFAA